VKLGVLVCGKATKIAKYGKGYYRARRIQISSFIPLVSSKCCAIDV